MIFPSVFKVHLTGKENELVNRVLEGLEGIDRKEFTRAALVNLALEIVKRQNKEKQEKLYESEGDNQSTDTQETSEEDIEVQTDNNE